MLSALRLPLRSLLAASSSAALFSALSLERLLRDVDDARVEVYVRAWARSLLYALRVEVRVDPPEFQRETRASRGVMVVANHRSTLDILLLLELFGGHLLARGDMERWPVMGKLASTAGTLFVDREDPASGAAAIRRMRERLARGRTIGVFPEGTTFGGDEVRPFFGGAFIAAARERSAIVPVGIAYEDEGAIFGDEPIGPHLRRLAEAERTRVGVSIGEPIDPRSAPLKELPEHARAAVQARVHRARALLSR